MSNTAASRRAPRPSCRSGSSRRRGRRGRADARAGRSGRAARAGPAASNAVSPRSRPRRRRARRCGRRARRRQSLPRPRAARRCRRGSAGRSASLIGPSLRVRQRFEHVAVGRAPEDVGVVPKRVEQQHPGGEAVPAVRSRRGTAPRPGPARRSRQRPAVPRPADPSRAPCSPIHSPIGTVKPCLGPNGLAAGQFFASHWRSRYLPVSGCCTFSPSGRRNAAAATPGSRNGVRPSMAWAIRQRSSLSSRSFGSQSAMSVACAVARRERPLVAACASAAAMPSRQSTGRVAQHVEPVEIAAPAHHAAARATTAASRCDSGRSRRKSRRRLRRTARPSTS